MKNDILLFAVMFAVAWIGFGALKGHLQLPAGDDTIPAAKSPAEDNLIAATKTDDTMEPAGSQGAKQEKNKQIDRSKSKTAKVISTTDGETENSADPDSSQSQEQVIEKVLMDQTQAWNRGDLDGFMEAYWKDENLTFSGAGGTTVGFEDTYANYRNRYPEGEMGRITFKDLKTEMVSEESAIVTGRFDHQLQDEDVRGNFSLVLKSFDGQWKIIHDHTSVAE